jgi:glycosyltransferase involved in cell wall biosynthesis
MAAAGKVAFALRAAACLVRREPVDIILCGHRNLLPVAWGLARLKGVRLVLVIHGVEAWTPGRSRVLNWLAGRIDALISVSRVSAQRFCAWSRFPIEDVTILPNCVDFDRFRPQPKNAALLERHALGQGPVIMTVGRILANERYKGFDEVLAAMPRLLVHYPTMKYLIVGDGSDRVRLEEKVRAMGLGEAVVFAGRIAEIEKVAYYNLADAYVMPSSGEGFGIVLIEALACGVPVVGSSIDGARDALLGGELGRLVDPTDTDALVDAIAAALAQGRGKRAAGLDVYSEHQFKARVSAWIGQACKN